MALSFGFYLDPALTTRIISRPQFVQALTAPTPSDKVIYFGSPLAGHLARAAVSPGVAPIVVSLTDSAPGTAPGATAVKLALSAAGLASAVAGAALNLPAEVAGGPAGAVAIHLRVQQGGLASGVYNDLGLTTNSIGEWA